MWHNLHNLAEKMNNFKKDNAMNVTKFKVSY